MLILARSITVNGIIQKMIISDVLINADIVFRLPLGKIKQTV